MRIRIRKKKFFFVVLFCDEISNKMSSKNYLSTLEESIDNKRQQVNFIFKPDPNVFEKERNLSTSDHCLATVCGE